MSLLSYLMNLAILKIPNITIINPHSRSTSRSYLFRMEWTLHWWSGRPRLEPYPLPPTRAWEPKETINIIEELSKHPPLPVLLVYPRL